MSNDEVYIWKFTIISMS